MVDLVLLHGPPASGKLTIAKELAALTGARVFHNHLTIDVAKSLIDFGEPGFWELVYDLRLSSYKSFFEYGTRTAITTWCYEEPEDLKLFLAMKSIAMAEKGRVLPVFLHCETSDLEKRISNADRRAIGKLCDVEQLRKILADKNYSPVPDDQSIQLDSGKNPAHYNAQQIVNNFGL